MLVSTTTSGILSKFGYEKTFSMIKEAGFDAIDYGYFDDPQESLSEDYINIAKAQRALLDKLELICGQTHAPFDFRYGEATDKTSLHYEWIVRSMEASVILGAENIVIHSIGVPDGVDEFEYNVDFYKSLIPYAEKFGIKISIENLFYAPRGERYFRGRFADAEELSALLDVLNSPVFNICIDIGHELITGRIPENVIRSLNSDILATVHLHDNNTWDDQHRIPYFGVIEWDEVCSALGEIGYKGNFNGEIYYGNGDEQTIRETLAYAQKILRRLSEKVDKARYN